MLSWCIAVALAQHPVKAEGHLEVAHDLSILQMPCIDQLFKGSYPWGHVVLLWARPEALVGFRLHGDNAAQQNFELPFEQPLTAPSMVPELGLTPGLCTPGQPERHQYRCWMPLMHG